VEAPLLGGVALNTNLIDDRKECAMKLTSAQVERTLSQFQGEAIPDNDPVVPQLNSLFGEHTFFLDSNGLNIVEPTEAAGSGAIGQAGERCQLERRQSKPPGAARTRTDRRRRHTWIQTLIQI